MNGKSSQVAGETAKQLSERFGKIMQDQESISISRNDTIISRSKRLELAISKSKISSLSSGEFVGIVAENPDQKIEVKTFYGEIINDLHQLSNEQIAYSELPVISEVKIKEILENYLGIKKRNTVNY